LGVFELLQFRLVVRVGAVEERGVRGRDLRLRCRGVEAGGRRWLRGTRLVRARLVVVTAARGQSQRGGQCDSEYRCDSRRTSMSRHLFIRPIPDVGVTLVTGVAHWAPNRAAWVMPVSVSTIESGVPGTWALIE